MSKGVNNFPREGEHSPVTKAMLDYMREARGKMNARLEYTVGGPAEARVHTNLHAQTEAAIANGQRKLDRAQDNIENDYVFAANNGRAKASFNHLQPTSHETIVRKVEVRTYVERQRSFVRNHSQSRDLGR